MSAGGGQPGRLAPRVLGHAAGAQARDQGRRRGSALIGAPDGFDATLGELPDGVRVRRRLGGPPLDVIVAFFSRRVGARAPAARR